MEEDNNKKSSMKTSENGSPIHKPVLGFKIPDQRSDNIADHFQDVKKANDWFDELPMMNIGETSRRVYENLFAFNRSALPLQTRAKITELFRQPVEYINSNLLKNFSGTGFPLTHKGEKSSELAIQLFTELAISYKSIIEQMLSGEDANFDRNLLIISLHRCMYYMYRLLAQLAVVYRIAPAGIWRDIHTIYTYASQNLVHQVQVESRSRKKDSKSPHSIEELYKCILLLATTNTFSLRQEYILRLPMYLCDWTSLVGIKAYKEPASTTGLFQVNLWSDQPPGLITADETDANVRCKIIDTNRLLDELRKQFDQPADKDEIISGSKSHPSRTLLRTLIRAWSRSGRRKYARTPLEFELHTVLGLNNIHYLLEQEYGVFSAIPTKTANTDAIKPDGRTRDPIYRSMTESEWSDSLVNSLATATFGEEDQGDSAYFDSYMPSTLMKQEKQPDPAIQQEHKKSPGELFTALTYNESAEGYSISWKGKDAPRVKVGELIGIQSTADAKAFGLGVVRWLKTETPDDLRLGIHVISPHCLPATVKPTENTQSFFPQDQYHCLLLMRENISNRQMSIISSAVSFKVGSTLRLILKEGECLIKLTRLTETSGAFAHYQFNYVKDTCTDDAGSKKDFGDLWNNL